VIVATEDNVVAALDAITGTTVWQQRLGPSVAHAVDFH
jgi:outer membrane protein assembly factor BamB